MTLDALRDGLPEPARDIRLNLQAVLQPGTLSAAQRYGVAIAVAVAARNSELAAALAQSAGAEVSAAVVDDAHAAAALMAMSNILYRFRHMIGKESYGQRPARLRMQRLAKPAAAKADFELMCLAVSAVNGCEACMRAHEKTVLDNGLTEEHVHDAIRVAAVVFATAVALGIPATSTALAPEAAATQ